MPKNKNPEPDAGLSIEYRRLDSIEHLPRNPKSHDIGSIVVAVREFGVIDPIGVNDKTGHDLDGNGRLKALRAMMAENRLMVPRGVRVDKADGMWLVPVVRGIRLDAQTEERAALALNRVHDLGEYDDDVLATVLSDLAARNKLAATGYDGDDLDALLRSLGRSGHGPSGPGTTDGKADGTIGISTDGWVKLEFVLPEDMRDKIIATLRAIQKDRGLGTLYEALHALAQEIA